ncbi:MAG: thiol:disulfide interchange protein DsbA/DsbL [Gammaproteobacteria bacterium]|nr:thiol:disulfide interchange protein DsbA/DsbL [Gammaproteobacteria bacterium]
MKHIAWLLGLLFITVGPLAAQQEPFTEGIHYQALFPQVPTDAAQGKVEVVALFWYGCPHCYQLEPYVSNWLKDKPGSIDFKRMPATMNPGWVTHARVYLALELIGELERIHPLIFLAIHEQGRRLQDLKSINRFLAQQGVDVNKFLEAYQSPEAQTKLRRVMWLNQQYGAPGVPAIVVNGKYLSSASTAGGYVKLLELIEFIIKKESNS